MAQGRADFRAGGEKREGPEEAGAIGHKEQRIKTEV